MRDHPDVRVKPPFVLLALLILAGLLTLAKPVGLFRAGWARLSGLPFVLTGASLIRAAIRQMQRHGTNIDPGEPVNALVVSGPFRYTRNPIYLGLTLSLAGLGFLVNSLWFLPFAGFFAGILQTQVIRYEEQFLEARFGALYRQYKTNVRRWI